MSGDIYFGFDKSNPEQWQKNDGYVDTPTFMGFGDLLDAALAKEYSEPLEVIKAGESMAIYCFNDLPASDYNAVVNAIRNYIVNLVNPTDWQQKGIWVWREMAEPFIRKDDRYDFAFHHEELPKHQS
jgi:hypothetical protein